MINNKETFLCFVNLYITMKDDDICFLCSYWSPVHGRDPERIELCKKHKMFMRGTRHACSDLNKID